MVTAELSGKKEGGVTCPSLVESSRALVTGRGLRVRDRDGGDHAPTAALLFENRKASATVASVGHDGDVVAEHLDLAVRSRPSSIWALVSTPWGVTPNLSSA